MVIKIYVCFSQPAYLGLCLGKQELVDAALVRRPGAEDKGLDLAKITRRDRQHFDCATCLHKAREMPKEEFKQGNRPGRKQSRGKLSISSFMRASSHSSSDSIETAALILSGDDLLRFPGRSECGERYTNSCAIKCYAAAAGGADHAAPCPILRLTTQNRKQKQSFEPPTRSGQTFQINLAKF